MFGSRLREIDLGALPRTGQRYIATTVDPAIRGGVTCDRHSGFC
jgi:hypothetical protein